MPFPVDDEWIRAAEEKLGVRLPDSYRRRLLVENGGEIEADGQAWFLYPVRDESDRKRLSRTCEDIVSETVSAREWRRFPQAAVAVGDNAGGDRLVLLPKEGHTPT